MQGNRWRSVLLLLSLMSVWGCDSSSDKKTAACKDGESQSCSCDGGASGEQTCKDGAFEACDCSGGDASANTSKRVKGRVFDAETGRAIEGAEVKTDAGETVKTSQKGTFELPADEDTKQVTASAQNYSPTAKDAPKEGGYMELFVKDVDAEVEFDAEKGVTVELDSGASVQIPGGAVKERDGSEVKGMVKLTVSDVDGSDRKQAGALPGEMRAQDDKGKGGQVGVARAMNITVKNASGTELTVGEDKGVYAEFPIKSASAPAEASSFAYDADKGFWVEEEKAKRTVNNKGQRVYRKKVDHLSWHAYGDFFASLTCVRACVEDGDGKALQGAQVWLVGSSFAGASTLFTGSDGCAATDTPVTQDVVLVGQNEDGVSKAAKTTTGSAEQSAADDPAACPLVGPLVIGAATDAACPAGFSECAGNCRDTSTDPSHCGACGGVCDGTAGRGQACEAGECACPEGTTTCGSGAELACANTDLDPGHCGDCDTVCNAQQECVGGQCVEAQCTEGTQRCGADCVDTLSNRANCGQCGRACEANLTCVLGECRDPAQLCTNNPQINCDDGRFCNGTETCSPQSPGALQNGCFFGLSPCGDTQSCDEELDMCVTTMQCASPPTFRSAGQVPSCAPNIIGCVSGATEVGNLGSLIACGAADQTAADGNDELGGAFDCESCLRNDLMICAQGYGCAQQVDALYCCVLAAKCTDQACIESSCASQFAALDSCFDGQVPFDPQNPSITGRCYSFINNSTCIGG